MGIKQSLLKLIGSTSEAASFAYETNPNTVDFYIEHKRFDRIKSGKEGGLLEAQYVWLKMLQEQEDLVSLPNGFEVPEVILTRLSDDDRDLLCLPSFWQGTISASIKGTTGSAEFDVQLKISTPDGRMTTTYKLNGPFIQFGSKQYLLKNTEYTALLAVQNHNQERKSEANNLKLIHTLQSCQANSQTTTYDFSHFNKLKIHVPETISISAEIDESGNLVLTPQTGQSASPEQLERVLGQALVPGSHTLKVKDEIILLDDKQVDAVQEIIANRTIRKELVADFLNNPTSYIDASLVDLDLGFSVRVHGMTQFKHAYFGETDESKIDWFGQTYASNSIQPITNLPKSIKDPDQIQEAIQKVSDAQATGATEVEIGGTLYDLSDKEKVVQTQIRLQDKLKNRDGIQDEEPSDEEELSEVVEEEEPTGPTVVDIDLNDELLDSASSAVEQSISDVSYTQSLDWDSEFSRKPYEHQESGVRWALGLINKQHNEESIEGALLADDMGLGKTFMALASNYFYYQQQGELGNIHKPTLIVAPLSLLENWKDEVDKTFSSSPFKDIVILQSDGQLNDYREGGAETKQTLSLEEDAQPKYSLKVGSNFGPSRLDMPGRLVITTYQTLRDYQFSMCLIDWGMVIFDEAQNIKNPNALQTRAAKGLKADFKLVATGTPVENSLADFWCLMDTACPGYLGSYQDFRNEFVKPITQAAGDEVQEIRARLGRELRIKVGALMLRRTKEDNLKGLPQKSLFVGVRDSDWQYSPALEQVMAGFQKSVYEGAIQNKNEDEEAHALTTIQRLRDCSLHPRLVEGGLLNVPKKQKELQALISESKKLECLFNILKEIKQRNEKCIVFAVNKRLQLFLSGAIGHTFGLGLLSVINGDTKAVAKRAEAATRKTLIKDFEDREGFNVIIMSPVAAGVGLTVVGANNVIHFERHWNPAKEAQATDRVYRIGQNKDVNVYVPTLHHPEYESFDVNLHQLLSTKNQLKDAVVTPEDVMPTPGGLNDKIFTPETIIQPDDLKRLSWQQFEAFVVELLSKDSNVDSAWLTKSGNDYGADGVLKVNDGYQLIQVKHKSGDYQMGYKAVQELVGAKPVYSDNLDSPVNELVFVTNASRLNTKASDIAKQSNVQILYGKTLEKRMLDTPISFSQVLGRLDKARLKI